MSAQLAPVAAEAATTVHIRPATIRDHPAIHAVVSAAYQQYQGILGPRLFSRYLADLLDVDRHSRHGRLLVAEVAGRVRGSGAFYPDSSVQGLGWPPGWAGGRALAVHPEARRQGVARAMIATLERLAHRHRAPVFAFHTASFMSEAIALYERLGYRRAAEYDPDLSDHFAVTDGPRVLAIAYRRDIPRTASRGVTRSDSYPPLNKGSQS